MEARQWDEFLAAILAGIAALLLDISALRAQGSPQIVWEAPTPSGLANSVLGVAWSPGASGRVAVASTDRWVRARQASNGALLYSVLQPHRSGGADQVVYSTDGLYLAVHNRSGGLGYRIHRSADGAFLGDLGVTLGGNSLVQFAASQQLIDAVGGTNNLPRWRISDFTIVHTVGSGYTRVTTVFNFSPNGTYQSAASRGSIKIQRRSDAATVRTIAGGAPAGTSVVAFTPDSLRIAAFSPSPNQTTLWRVSDGVILTRFPRRSSRRRRDGDPFQSGWGASGDDRLPSLCRRQWALAAEGNHPLLARRGWSAAQEI